MAEQIEVLQRAAALTAEAMPRLRTMKDLAEYWIEINRLENTGDQVYRRIIAKLFSGETDALTVMKVKAVVDSLEAAVDAFEHIANTVEQIAVKEVLSCGARARHRASSSIALVFDYTNGFHDAANAIATSVSTRALTPRVALLLARGDELPRRVPRHRGGRDRRQGHHRAPRPASTGWWSCCRPCSARSPGT